MAGHSKRAGRAAAPVESRTPRGAGAASLVSNSLFRWRVEAADLDGPRSWENSTVRSLFQNIIPKLHHFETMTWARLESAQQHHFVSVLQISPMAQKRLIDLGHDCDDLFSLRLTGRQRVWGPREGTIFQVLWWDPDHSVCPSKKKPHKPVK